MKKRLYVAAMLAVSLSLGSCGEASKSTVEDTSIQTTTTVAETTTTATTTVTTTIIETEPIVEEKEPTPQETIEKPEEKKPKAILQKQVAKRVDYDNQELYFEGEYREDGKPLSEISYMGNLWGDKEETIYEYDDDNNLIKKSVYVTFIIERVYGDNGLDWEKTRVIPPSLHKYTSYEYEKGLLKTKTVHLNQDSHSSLQDTVTTTYEYNDKKDITKKTIVKANGRTEMNEYAYKYDKDGKILEIELTATDPLGEKTNVTSVYKYDGNGNLIEINNVLDIVQSPSLVDEYEYDSDDDFSREAIAYKIVYEYDSSNRITSETLYDLEGAYELGYETRRLEYDANGNIVKKYTYNSYYEYEYDENDNLISEIEFDSDSLHFSEPIKEIKLNDEVYRAYDKIIYENTYY